MTDQLVVDRRGSGGIGYMISRFLDRIAGRIEHADQLDQPSEVIAAVVDKVLASRRVTGLASGSPIGADGQVYTRYADETRTLRTSPVGV